MIVSNQCFNQLNCMTIDCTEYCQNYGGWVTLHSNEACTERLLNGISIIVN